MPKTTIIGKKNKSQYLALIINDGPRFLSFILDCQTKELTSKLQIIADSPKSFIENIFTSFGNKGIKAVFFNIFRIKDTADCPNTVEYCKAIKAKFEQLKIPYYFISNQIYNITNFFIQSKIKAVKDGDNVINFIAGENDLIFTKLFVYTKDGYKHVKNFNVNVDANQEGKIIRHNFIQESSPKIISALVLPSGENMLKFLQKSVFTKSDNFIPIKLEDLADIEKNFLIEKLKWLIHKNCSKYHLFPFTYNEYVYFVKVGENLPYRLVINSDELLPFTKKEYIPNLNLDYFVGYIDGHTKEKVILEQIPYTKNAHKHEIILSIDEQHFPDIQIKPITIDEICKFPETLNHHLKKTKIPVIGFFEGFFSVTCYYNNDKNGYQFVDAWNCLYGRPLFISFDKEKPTYGEAAVQIYKEKPNFVVSDLISVLSQDSSDIQLNDTWGFTVTNDSSNPILLEFDTFEGIRKLATPNFLMAMLLKQHLKAIKKEMGEKPKELAFYLFDIFDSEAKQRIKKGLEESCKLLKIGFMMFDF